MGKSPGLLDQYKGRGHSPQGGSPGKIGGGRKEPPGDMGGPEILGGCGAPQGDNPQQGDPGVGKTRGGNTHPINGGEKRGSKPANQGRQPDGATTTGRFLSYAPSEDTKQMNQQGRKT